MVGLPTGIPRWSFDHDVTDRDLWEAWRIDAAFRVRINQHLGPGAMSGDAQVAVGLLPGERVRPIRNVNDPVEDWRDRLIDALGRTSRSTRGCDPMCVRTPMSAALRVRGGRQISRRGNTTRGRMPRGRQRVTSSRRGDGRPGAGAVPESPLVVGVRGAYPRSKLKADSILYDRPSWRLRRLLGPAY